MARSLGKSVEARLARERVLEEKQVDLMRMVNDQQRMSGYAKSEGTVEKLRRKRDRAQEAAEMLTDYTYVKAEQDRERKGLIGEMEVAFAKGVERKHAAEYREDQHRRRVCNESEELKHLKEKLNTAAVNRARAAQMLEKQVRLENEKKSDNVLCARLEEERLETLELDRMLEGEKTKQRHQVAVINKEQIAAKEARRSVAFEEYCREKREVADLVSKLEMENAMEKAARMEKQVEMQAAIKKFRVEQDNQRQAMEQKDKEELQKIEEYARAKREREEALAKEEAKKEAEKQRILKKSLDELEKKNKQSGELEYLRNELFFEEHEAEMRRKEAQAVRKKLEDRMEMLQAYEASEKLKDEKRRKEVEEELRFRDQLMAKYAEDDRVEQMKDQVRRLKVQEHRRLADAQVAQKREMFDAQRQQEVKKLERLRRDEEERLKIIEDERRRLLRQHAGELADFLPKGTLEKPADMELLNLGRRPTRCASMPSIR